MSNDSELQISVNYTFVDTGRQQDSNALSGHNAVSARCGLVVYVYLQPSVVRLQKNVKCPARPIGEPDFSCAHFLVSLVILKKIDDRTVGTSFLRQYDIESAALTVDAEPELTVLDA